MVTVEEEVAEDGTRRMRAHVDVAPIAEYVVRFSASVPGACKRMQLQPTTF